MSTSLEAATDHHHSVELDKQAFIRALSEIVALRRLSTLRSRVSAIKEAVASANGNRLSLACRPARGQGAKGRAAQSAGEAVSLRRDVLVSELEQILEARTLERARYYVRRLERGLKRVKTGAVNDINLLRWKEYAEVLTDSLWVLPRRDATGAHLGWYWGNFIPQIPRQLMLRYTKKGDWVLDPFLGSGTTLIECRRLGRNGLGVELNPEIAPKAEELIEREPAAGNVTTRVVVGDSRTLDLRSALRSSGAKHAQLVIMHPPYHDIIKFSRRPEDLSNADGQQAFLSMLGEVVENVSAALERGRYLALIIGDKYSKGEWVPLGFQAMNEVLSRGFLLKSIIVKNFEETRAKREQKQLWRYRALAGGFYIFKHEYIFLFKKR